MRHRWNVLCTTCFDEEAEAAGVAYDFIQVFPVSWSSWRPPIPENIIDLAEKAAKFLDEQNVPTVGRRIRYRDPESGQVVERQIPDPEEVAE